MSTVEIMAEANHDEISALNGAKEEAYQRRLDGKVVIVTGGTGGIGEATVRLFAKHGAKVVIADINDAAGRRLMESLGPLVTYRHCNVSEEPEMEQLVQSTISQHGQIDVFFNNAGLLGSLTRSITEFDVDEFERLVRVNILGTAIGMKHAARVMIPQRAGCIISTASVAGIMGGLGPNAYSATKHAVAGLTKNVACELGRYGIRVNCISPYGVATSMILNAMKGNEFTGSGTPSKEEAEMIEEVVRSQANLKGATLKAQDIAEAALYLASDESMYVSGHNLVVDGGVTAGRNAL